VLSPSRAAVAVALLLIPAATRAQQSPPYPSGAARPDVEQLLATGDEAFARRHQGASGAQARAEPIGEAVAAHRRALELAPERIDVRARLLHSLFFVARYATPSPSRKKALYEEGRDVFEQGLARLKEDVGKRLDSVEPEALPELLAEHPHAGELYFWGAVHWGLWGESFGTMASVRRGVAGRIRRYGESAKALVPDYQNAGAYRLLGRLHALAPRVPLFTGWIDHDLAVDYLERAVELAPEDPLNLYFLADALLEYRRDQSERAARLLESAAGATPRPDRPIEDAEAITDARARLAKLRGS
jgi:tetratricopeptide (TPR) repeat protein